MGQCVSPFTRKENRNIPLPCGKCYECRTRRAQGWMFRLQQELKQSTSAHFITLTYEDKYLPRTENNFKTLKKSDLQNFIKRLRNEHEKHHKALDPDKKSRLLPIKYYAAGEYGGKHGRPHYHIILFNADPDLVYKSWTSDKREKGEENVIGNIHIGTVTPASIAYCLKYICKSAWRKKHENDDRQPEFSLMSKQLGSNYLSESYHYEKILYTDKKGKPRSRTIKKLDYNSKSIKWHQADIKNRAYLPYQGKKSPMPRYYKDKIYSQEDKVELQIHFNSEERKQAKFYVKYWSKQKYDKFLTNINLKKIELAHQFLRKAKKHETDFKLDKSVEHT